MTEPGTATDADGLCIEHDEPNCDLCKQWQQCRAGHPEYGFTCTNPRNHESRAHFDATVGHSWLDDGRSSADWVAADQPTPSHWHSRDRAGVEVTERRLRDMRAFLAQLMGYPEGHGEALKDMYLLEAVADWVRRGMLLPADPLTHGRKIAPPHTKITQYTVSCLPEDSINHTAWSITVEHRGRGQWAVLRGRRCLGYDGTWDFESIPSEREDEWLAEHRFTEQEALRLAAEWAHRKVAEHGVIEEDSDG